MTSRVPHTQTLRARVARLRPRSLRRKIVVGVLVLLSLSFVLVAAVTTFALRGFLVDRLEQQLLAAGTRFSLSLEHPNDQDSDNDPGQFQTVSGQAAGTLGARILDGAVTAAAVVGRNQTSAGLSAAARGVLAKLTATTHPVEVHIPDLGEYRVIVARGDDGDLLLTGLPEAPVNDTIARLIVIEGIVFGAALVAVGLGSAAFVRLALRPLDRVADTAARVAGLPLASGAVSLQERVPPAPPDTEVGKVSAAFNQMLEEVESALVQRQASEDRLRHFIADASHELRTPLAVVRSHAEYALRAGDADREEMRRSLERITAESDRMGRLVEDLLLLARLDSGRRLAADEVDITRVVLDAVSDARVAGPDHRWRLTLPEEPVVVIGDDHALHQVMSNLLANARTHTPPGTHVHTRLDLLDDARSVEVSVTDDGPGIPETVAPHVFERFARGDESRPHMSGNSGLGLSIVSAIVTAHGGAISVRTEPGRTSFVLTVPISSAEQR